MSGVMQLEDFYARNLQNLLRYADLRKPVTVTRIQQHCRVGYNQALHTIDYCERLGVLVKTETPGVYQYNEAWALEEIARVSDEIGLYDEDKECTP